MYKRSSFNSDEIVKRAEQLMNAASNRYRITVRVAKRAKRRRSEDKAQDNLEDPLMTPPIRAIIEMSDEVTQPEILVE
ncbi:DNA-directed RNA polymerase subunit omega [Halothece sp. PCC 7418]|uniref:DNA-directed RNA polymerase subunit omega n=1 Tax=Halothece sp. (strain PCC 7418) TaxID=65093 RepID=UPI0002A07E40|nr:DNA-directed RNA polymerase subunit omega [Halothece sp. PCC 7418]AFZ43275.1 DNA-directed RNA polymerase subunit omega [Halothece sp. PCC 7418]